MNSQKQLILAIDDELDMLETYRSILGKKYTLLTASNPESAMKILEKQSPALILLDLRLPKISGLELLEKIKLQDPTSTVIIITASKDIADAVESMKAGASDYITKPFDVKELLVVIEKGLNNYVLNHENIKLKALLKGAAYENLIGSSPAMQKVFQMIENIANTDTTILLQGESGTGKELAARAVHQKSRRAGHPFVAVNCAAIPDNLLESELFGYERGAFTGALERKLGKFELADGGTIFLDEIGCLPVGMQSKLLRVIESKLLSRLGGEKELPINVRIVAATNINFEQAIEAGKFRQDLYYRINVIPITLPPLRERKSDIPLLTRHFLQKFTQETNKLVKGFTPEAEKALLQYNWPGNVRELQNLIERLVVLSRHDFISLDDLNLRQESPPLSISNGALRDEICPLEKEKISAALVEAKNNKAKAARLLGIPRTTLNSRLAILGLS